MNHIERPAESAAAISPELAAQERARHKAIRRVSKLRQKASDEIERLISFLDASDPYVQTEAEPNGDELDVSYPHRGPHLMTGFEDDEPSLGAFDRMVDQTKAWRRSLIEPVEIDAELDTADAEPSLGSLEWDNQTRWGASARADLEEQCDDEGSAA